MSQEDTIKEIIESVSPTIEDIEKMVDEDAIVTTLITNTLAVVPQHLHAQFKTRLKNIACLAFLGGARFGSDTAFACIKAGRIAHKEGRL